MSVPAPLAAASCTCRSDNIRRQLLHLHHVDVAHHICNAAVAGVEAAVVVVLCIAPGTAQLSRARELRERERVYVYVCTCVCDACKHACLRTTASVIAHVGTPRAQLAPDKAKRCGGQQCCAGNANAARLGGCHRRKFLVTRNYHRNLERRLWRRPPHTTRTTRTCRNAAVCGECSTARRSSRSAHHTRAPSELHRVFRQE